MSLTWNEVSTQKDADALLRAYGHFHDSCIASVTYQSGASVDSQGAMSFGAPLSYQATVVFQRQWQPAAIELRFSGLRQLHIGGWQQLYTCEIAEASLRFVKMAPEDKAPVIVWADSDGFCLEGSSPAAEEPLESYIVAQALKWRFLK